MVVVVGTAIGLEGGHIFGEPFSATGEDGGVRGTFAGVVPPKDFEGDAVVGDFVGVPVLLKEPAGEGGPVEAVSWGLLVILVSISDSS